MHYTDRHMTDYFSGDLKEKFEAATKALGLPSKREALSYAFDLLLVAQRAKEQGKELCVATMEGGPLVLDAKITPESLTGNVSVQKYNNSNFDINKPAT